MKEERVRRAGVVQWQSDQPTNKKAAGLNLASAMNSLRPVVLNPGVTICCQTTILVVPDHWLSWLGLMGVVV